MKPFGKRKWQRKWKFVASGLIVLATIFVLWPFRFSYDSICSRCGAEKQTIEWQLPHSDHTFFTWSFTTQTPLSSYLTSSGTVGEHSHRWLFGHGGGNGIKCALGDGDPIRPTVMSPEVVHLLAFSRQFGDRQEYTNFLNYAFDRNISRAVRSIASSMPTNGFASRDQYRAWLNDHNFIIEDAIEVQKETELANTNIIHGQK